MSTLSDLQFFVRAGRAASLSEAARAFNISPAAGSALVKRLEAELGAKLFVLSTRNLRLTNDGLQFLQQCEQALEILATARENLLSGRNVIKGAARISLPSDLGRNVVLPWLHELRVQHPGVDLQLQLSDRLAELYREQVDIALRYGEPADSNLIAVPVAPENRRILCASPAYLAAHGAPRAPQDLRDHHCLCFMLSGRTHNRWNFSRGKEQVKIEVSCHVQCDDGDAVRKLALMGEGVAYKSWLDVATDVKKGALVALCGDWLGEPAPLYLAYADKKQMRPLVRLLREFLTVRLAAHG